MPSLSFLQSITFTRVRVIFEACDTIILPVYKGSAFRGCLGGALLNETCTHFDQPCETCIARFNCPFSLLFNSYVPISHPHQRKYSKSPHPYIVDPFPDEKTVYLPGETFGFVLTLIGSAKELLPIVEHSFNRMGKMGIGKDRGRFTPINVETLMNQNEFDFSSFSDICNKLTLSFESPLRLKQERELQTSPPPFDLFIRRLTQRLTLLAHFHCGAPWIETNGWFEDELNVVIVDSQLRWVDWRRYSGTQDAKMNFDGHIGTITYIGDLTPWISILLYGSWLHAGLTTTFGLGKYKFLFNG